MCTSPLSLHCAGLFALSRAVWVCCVWCRLILSGRALGRQLSGSSSSATGPSSSSSSTRTGLAAALAGRVSQAVAGTRAEEEGRGTSGLDTGAEGGEVLAVDMFTQDGSLPRMIAAISAPQVISSTTHTHTHRSPRVVEWAADVAVLCVLCVV